MKKAIIFDLDGVIVSTDGFHYKAWKQMANREGIYFDETINNRLRGVSRMESLAIILERANRTYTDEEKAEMASMKNELYRESLSELTPADILPGVMDLLQKLRAMGLKLAIGSSSRNTPTILKQIGLGDYFDAVADGNGIQHSKPDPEVFLLAAKLLNLPAKDCVVVEDAFAGIDAALAGGMKAVGVGDAARYEKATITAPSMADLTPEQVAE
ncbi:MAG: beta-phosphoglucomutase [Oscillospiraceae bacterium]